MSVGDIDQAARATAVERAKVNSALSGYTPTEYGLSVFEQWIAGHWSVDEAIALLVQHHKEIDASASTSDEQASVNKLSITDSLRLKVAVADITILRMAVLAL